MIAALYIDAPHGPTPHDLRVVRGATTTCDSYDGWAPHGVAEHGAVWRLVAQGLLVQAGTAVCMDCDTAKHRACQTEVRVYRPTDAGRRAVETYVKSP